MKTKVVMAMLGKTNHPINKNENKEVESEHHPANSQNNDNSTDEVDANVPVDDNEFYDEGWEPPPREATNKENKKMFSEALGIIVKILMNNHIYKFAGPDWKWKHRR